MMLNAALFVRKPKRANKVVTVVPTPGKHGNNNNNNNNKEGDNTNNNNDDNDNNKNNNDDDEIGESNESLFYGE